MSSWILAKNKVVNKVKPLISYHTTAESVDIPSTFMDFLAAYIYSQKMGEPCTILDPSTLISSSLKYNPQIKLLKEAPSATVMPTSTYTSIVNSMKYSDIRKYASRALELNSGFHHSILLALEKASIKTLFDIGIHITSQNSNLQEYVDTLKLYQQKIKKNSITVYVLTDSYSTVLELQKLSDPSWRLISLSKNPPTYGADIYIQMMAEIQIMSSLPSLVLDFNHSIDRLIYLMHKHKAIDFFKEINNQPWYLI